MMRLRRAGLTLDEEATVTAAYQALTDAEKFEWLTAIEYLSDEELAEQIVEGRVDGTVSDRIAAADVVPDYTGEPQDDEDHVDWSEVPDGTVGEVLAWVGDNQHLASAALIAEQRRHETPRKTLVAALEQLLNGG